MPTSDYDRLVDALENTLEYQISEVRYSVRLLRDEIFEALALPGIVEWLSKRFFDKDDDSR